MHTFYLCIDVENACIRIIQGSYVITEIDWSCFLIVNSFFTHGFVVNRNRCKL